MKNNLLYIAGLLAPLILIFHPLITNYQIVAGDAPHFTSTELSELVSEPQIWTNRGENLGGIDPRLFISPLLIVYGLLGNLGFSNAIIVRLLFYIPSLLLSIVGPYLLSRQLKLTKAASYLSSLLYVFNTYYILLVDGGQVGIVLAYGLFPFVLLTLLRLLVTQSIGQFIISLITTQLLITADPRVAAIAFLLFSICVGFEVAFNKSVITRFKIKRVILFIVCLLGINLYWLYPLYSVGGSTIVTPILDVRFFSLLNGLTLYQPHWPLNIYGQITQPAWYFVGIIALLSFGLVVTKSKQYAQIFFVYLFFVFLLKGDNAPLGQVYQLLISLPFGSAFRDSSKFFMPVILLSGYLLGTFVSINKRHEKRRTGLVFIYLICIVLLSTEPFSFVLSKNASESSTNEVNSYISQSDGFARSIWFPERVPDTFEVKQKPALDAKSLTDLQPFANLNVGSSDKFNYLSKDETFLQWYKILGIKYLVFPGDMRNLYQSSEAKDEWFNLLNRMSKIPSLPKVDEVTTMPLYEIDNPLPRLYGVSSMALVVGPLLPDRYQFTPALYFEDGHLNPLDLESLDPASGMIVFNNTDKDDLTMAFLQRHFIYPNQAEESNWSSYSHDDYLLWKYQLLLRGIDTTTFDYGHDIALSSNTNEVISYSFNSPIDTDFVLALRVINSGGSTITYALNNTTYESSFVCPNEQIIVSENDERCRTNFSWITQGVKLKKGKNSLVITNKSGVTALNAIAFIPNTEWNNAQMKTEIFMNHFGVTRVEDLPQYEIDSYDAVDFSSVIPSKLLIKHLPENTHWLVYSDSYHPDWQLQRGTSFTNSLPVYSILNGFYVDKKWKDIQIIFRGQETFRWGVWGSVVSVLVITIIVLWKKTEADEK